LLSGKDNIEEIVEASHQEAMGVLEDEAHKTELTDYMKKLSLAEMDLSERQSIGYTYKCLGSAFFALKNWNDFQAGITKLTMQAGDSDTYKVIPLFWLPMLTWARFFFLVMRWLLELCWDANLDLVRFQTNGSTDLFIRIGWLDSQMN